MKIIFIRHGETEINIESLTHRMDDSAILTSKGKQQAEMTARVCAENIVSKMYSSPEKRAIETAEIIGATIKVKVRTLEGFRERDWGDWSGLAWKEIKSELDKMNLKTRYRFVPPNGESWEQMDQRLINALESISKEIDRNIAIVTHGGVLRALIPVLLNEPKETSFQYDFANASVSIFEIDGNRYNQIVINDTEHLI